MAFDLNKNDGSNKDSSNKTPASSKFDLSKGDVVATTGTENSSQSKMWIIGLVGLLIISGGILYYSSNTKAVSTVNSASTEVSTSDSSTAVIHENQANVQSDFVRDTTSVKNESTVPVPTASSDENTAVVNLNNRVLATFGQGSSSFINIDQSLIKRIISYLTENPEASISVNGYASSDGSLKINQTISQARADIFKKYLVSKNITESRIIAVGKGIQNPIASNNSNAGRKKNRRVEITLP